MRQHENIELYKLEVHALIDVLTHIALSDQRPGHVDYLTKAEISRTARDAIIMAGGPDPWGESP